MNFFGTEWLQDQARQNHQSTQCIIVALLLQWNFLRSNINKLYDIFNYSFLWNLHIDVYTGYTSSCEVFPFSSIFLKLFLQCLKVFSVPFLSIYPVSCIFESFNYCLDYYCGIMSLMSNQSSLLLILKQSSFHVKKKETKNPICIKL